MTGTSDRAGLTPAEKRALLVRHLTDRRRTAAEQPLPRLNRAGGDTYPLSFMQEELWFLQELAPGSPMYHSPLVYRLTGPLDRVALRRALDSLVERHESLRTRFPAVDGHPVQVVDAPLPMPIAEETVAADLAREGNLARRIERAVHRPFDLTEGPLARASLFRVGPEEHVLVLAMHHIVTDGRSAGVLWRDLCALYRNALPGAVPMPLPDLPVGYVDYAAWQRRQLTGDTLRELVEYWRRTLAGVAPLELSTTRTRSGGQSSPGAIRPFDVAPGTDAALRILGREEQATPFMVYFAAYATLLNGRGGEDDLAIGTFISGRNRPELQDVVGFFVNTVVLRITIGGDPTFRELLARVRRVVMAAFDHQDLPFRVLVEELRPDRVVDRNPLFQTMFTFDAGATGDGPNLAGVEAVPVGVQLPAAKFELSMVMKQRAGRCGGVVEYRSDLWDATTIAAMTGDWLHLLAEIGARPDGRVSTLLPGVPAPERHMVLVEYQGRAVDNAVDSGAHRLFEEQAAREPEGIALVSGARRLTYGEVNTSANRLAHLLIAAGVGPGHVVALVLERSFELVVGLLAVLKAGAAYLPIDPDGPVERMAFMLDDCRPYRILTTRAVEGRLPVPARPVAIALDEPGLQQAMADRPEHDPTAVELRGPLLGASAAYIVYTSGSTGRPKGVVGLHGGLLNRLSWFVDEFPDQARAVVCARTSLTFVDGTTELLGALLFGGTVVLADAMLSRDPAGLAVLLDRGGIERITLVPSLLRALLEETDPGLLGRCRFWVTSGERLPDATAARFRELLPHATLLNLYGSSEVSGDSLFARCTGPTVVIGRPIANTRVYVLDGRLRPVSHGVTGELYLAGPGLARGYLGSPTLTASMFIPDPYGSAGTRMYRTGDLVRWRTGGDLEFVGRRDQQVKIRGVRVELSEIEAALTAHPAVQEAVTAVREHDGQDRVVAYVVPVDGFALAAADLRRHLRAMLPEAFVPADVMVLATLPRTSTGKVDRRSLPTPRIEVATSGREPENARELALCQAFAEVLGIPRVGVDDNFFDLGGHSLLAARLVTKVATRLGVELNLRDIFAHPTVAGLVDEFRMLGADALDVLQPLRAGGDLSPLFCVAPVTGVSWCYSGLPRHLDPERPVFGLQALGLRRPDRLPRTVEELADAYVDRLRGIQPDGPYHLVGWSFGGLVAYTMAARLQREGASIGLLALLETYYPDPAIALGPVTERELLGALLGDPDRAAAWPDPMDRARVVAALREGDPVWAAADGRDVAAVAEVAANHLRLVRNFVPGRFEGRLLFFAATRGPTGSGRGVERWRRHVDGVVDVRHVDCTHWTMTEPGALRTIAATLAGEMESR